MILSHDEKIRLSFTIPYTRYIQKFEVEIINQTVIIKKRTQLFITDFHKKRTNKQNVECVLKTEFSLMNDFYLDERRFFDV